MPTTVFDPCTQPSCSHTFGAEWSQTQYNRNARPVRSWIAIFRTCTKCGFSQWLRNK